MLENCDEDLEAKAESDDESGKGFHINMEPFLENDSHGEEDLVDDGYFENLLKNQN